VYFEQLHPLYYIPLATTPILNSSFFQEVFGGFHYTVYTDFHRAALVYIPTNSGLAPFSLHLYQHLLLLVF
jgi:hypothetical protein